jgi:hypothetical protein
MRNIRQTFGGLIMKTVLAGTTLALVLVTVVHAQTGLTGRWQGETVSGRSVTLDLKAKGSELTGTITLVKEAAPISDGKVDKNTFSFTATVDGKTAAFSGVMAGDEVKLTVQGVKDPLVLKRVK